MVSSDSHADPHEVLAPVFNVVSMDGNGKTIDIAVTPRRFGENGENRVN